jgi:lipopolysaccharide export system ATP-binding protein
MAEAQPVLEAKGVHVELGMREILRNVSLQVLPGEVLGILGPSGAGKSTLFKILSGDLEIGGGTITLCGDRVEELPLWKRARKGLGYIPQEPSVFWDLTAGDNAALFAELRGIVQTPDSMLDSVNLLARKDVRASALSGGERRRLEFLRATLGRPRVILCDEPFSGVDPEGAKLLGDLLAAQAQAGVAVIIADHHVEEALRICTRAILLLDGAVAVSKTPELFRADPLVQGRYLGTYTHTR